MRRPRYQQIADTVRSRVLAGEFGRNELLPSEATLGRDYGASRVTVRRALEQLRDDGLLSSRQGLGWYPTTDPVRQPLDELVTLEHRLTSRGIDAVRRVLDFSFRAAPGPVADALGVDRVLEVRRVNLADGEPIARVTVWCPETLGTRFSRADVEARPFYDLLATIGVHVAGATQSILAGAASAEDGEVLAVSVGSPVLVCERITHSTEGRPVLMSEHVYPGHRMAFTVDLVPGAPASPSRLRLVE